MSRKSKINPIQKIAIVERVLTGKIGVNEAARRLGVDHSTIRKWKTIYFSLGPESFADQLKNKFYSKKLKLQAVRDYLNGEGSQLEICQKYGIRSPTQLLDWIKVYNTHREVKSRGSGGGSYMRKTTYKASS